MSALPNLLTASSIIFAANGAILAAERVPAFNIDSSCRYADDTNAPGRPVENCRRDERDARDKLNQEWSSFPAADKTRCVRLTTLGGTPSYVEVLTCLEMARDVRNLPPEGRDRNR